MNTIAGCSSSVSFAERKAAKPARWPQGRLKTCAQPVRRVIYTTNAIESINSQLRKVIKSRGHFPSDDAANNLIWLALRNITADWGRAAHNGKEGDEPIRDPLRGPIHESRRVA